MPPRRNVKKKKRKSYDRKKVCRFCADKLELSYKDASRLRHYTTERGKIIPRRISGNCARHQRALAIMVKRARALALLPFAGE
ncbi:30S ribosomal protein S18 [Candidatus Hydrogenedentota bacterium]